MPLSSFRSLAEITKHLQAETISITSLVEDYITKIDQNQSLNAFIEIFSDVRLQAQTIDKKLQSNNQGSLAGLVLGIKDLISIENQTVQGGSKILEGYKATYSSTAIERLKKADAVLLGRTNCDEFGMGSSNESSAFGPALNPIDNARVTGGSSGGSAAAVKAGLCTASLGTDTGGSVRQPAAFCDVIGFKPTYSRISRYGLLAYASSFDTIGIIGNTIQDIKNIYEVIAGHDPLDSTSSRKPLNSELKPSNPANKKILVFNETINHPGLDPEIKHATLSTIKALEKDGNEVIFKDFNLLNYILPAYYILTCAEASSNLSRYDGVKFGKRADVFSDLDSMYVNTRSLGFGSEVLRRIVLGTFVLSASYYDAYYTKAQKIRRIIKNEMSTFFHDFDFIVLPTTPTPPFKLGELTKNPLEMYLADLYTVIASVSGNPAISIPNGKTKDGLPIGLQIISADFQEQDMFAFTDYTLSLVK